MSNLNENNLDNDNLEFIRSIDNKVNNLEKDFFKLLKKRFRYFFKKFPILYGICWEQYTLNYDDGNPVEFKIRDVYIAFTKSLDYSYSSTRLKVFPKRVFGCDLEDDNLYIDELKYVKFSLSLIDENIKLLIEELNCFFIVIRDRYTDIFLSVFGKDTRIKFLRNGTVLIEENFDHR